MACFLLFSPIEKNAQGFKGNSSFFLNILSVFFPVGKGRNPLDGHERETGRSNAIHSGFGFLGKSKDKG
jgi:hypothetical protein